MPSAVFLAAATLAGTIALLVGVNVLPAFKNLTPNHVSLDIGIFAWCMGGLSAVFLAALLVADAAAKHDDVKSATKDADRVRGASSGRRNREKRAADNMEPVTANHGDSDTLLESAGPAKQATAFKLQLPKNPFHDAGARLANTAAVFGNSDMARQGRNIGKIAASGTGGFISVLGALVGLTFGWAFFLIGLNGPLPSDGSAVGLATARTVAVALLSVTMTASMFGMSNLTSASSVEAINKMQMALVALQGAGWLMLLLFSSTESFDPFELHASRAMLTGTGCLVLVFGTIGKPLLKRGLLAEVFSVVLAAGFVLLALGSAVVFEGVDGA